MQSNIEKTPSSKTLATTILLGFILIFSLLLVGTIVIYFILRASLPNLDGKILVNHVKAQTLLERDPLGTAVITAENREDVAFTLGFAHGQDRFFQMDLLRRNAAGELSELFGDAALPQDKSHRFHQFRHRATQIFQSLPLQQQAILHAYTEGVNFALSQQSVRSFEYLLLAQYPKPWQPEDSLLVIYSMYLDLQQGTIWRELTLEVIKHQFGIKMAMFINQDSQIQAALDNSTLPKPQVEIPQLPVDILQSAYINKIPEPPVIGSNNWAVTGQLTATGKAMLSNDMHLGLNVPIIWYRAQFNYRKQGQKIQITGLTLPGTPAMVIGSNGYIAWGFTNAYIDTADWVLLGKNQQTHISYQRINTTDKSFRYPIEGSEFGPVLNLGEQKYALFWVAHQNYGVNISWLNLEIAKNVTQGLLASNQVGMPVQNMLITDHLGNAAWKLTGAISQREKPSQLAINADEFQLQTWNISAKQVPQIVNPNHHRLWTANNRVVNAIDSTRLGNGGYANGSRAKQIRDRLMALNEFDEQSFFDMQLDNEAQFMSRWQALLLSLLKSQAEYYADDIFHLENWQGCACEDSVGYSLTNAFRNRMIDAAFAPIETRLSKQRLTLSPLKNTLEPAIWQLINQQPASWLPAKYPHWHSFMLQVYQDAKQALLDKHSWLGSLDDLNWGTINTLAIKHPFSQQIPMLGWLLDMPKIAGFGGHNEPAVQTTNFGASQRFVVQPSHEAQGIMVIPSGQSAHPLSAFYRAGFDDYANHRPTPLLPQKIIHRMAFIPK